MTTIQESELLGASPLQIATAGLLVLGAGALYQARQGVAPQPVARLSQPIFPSVADQHKFEATQDDLQANDPLNPAPSDRRNPHFGMDGQPVR